jgi:hypothetical protein
MKIAQFFFCLLVVGIQTAGAQYLGFNFVGHVRGPFTSGEYPEDVTYDHAGYKISIGGFSGTVDFDPDSTTFYKTAVSTQDIFILKTTPGGQLDWVVTIGPNSGGYSRGTRVIVDSLNNIYVVGDFYGSADFNPGAGTFTMSAGTAYATFILKLNAYGQFVWAKRLLTKSQYNPLGIQLDKQNNVYIGGTYQGTVDFDPGTGVQLRTSLGNTFINAYLLKLSSQGQYIWVRTFDSQQTVDFDDLYTNSEGISTIVGRAFLPMDADPDPDPFKVFTLFNNNSPYFFIIQLDAQGQFRWAKKINGLDGYTNFVVGTSKEDLIICGDINQAVDMDPGPGVFNLSGSGWNNPLTYVLRLDSNGLFEDAFKIGNLLSCETKSIAIDNNDNFYITGDFKGTVDFFPGPLSYTKTSNGDYDFFVTKYSSNFDLMYAESFGGTNWDWGKGISVNHSGAVCVVGRFTCSVDFDPDTTSQILTSQSCPPYAWSDMYLLNMNCSYNIGIDSITSCGPITWIDGNSYSFTGQQGTYTLTNQAGCDSLVFLDFTLDTTFVATGIDQITSCGPITWIDGNTYSNSNSSATYLLTSSRGCDSIVTLNFVLDTSYTKYGLDRVVACDSYTWSNGQTFVASNSIATDTLIGSNGCDSIVTLDLTIRPSKYFHHTYSVCDSLVWINGQTYYSSAKDTIWLDTYGGCDSIVTLDVIVHHPQVVYDSIITCDSIQWIDGITYYQNNNTAQHTLQSSSGCDSLVKLFLIINSSSMSNDVITACNSYTWIDGITYSASTNIATHILTNNAGCDSLISLDLTVIKVNENIYRWKDTLYAQQDSALYQWLDCDNGNTPIPGATQSFLPITVNGNFAVEINYKGCVVTSNCFPVNGISIGDLSKTQIKIYPNPSNGKVIINWGNASSNEIIEVYDQLGRLIEVHRNVRNGISVLNLHQQGVYQLRIFSNNSWYTQKLVITN